MFTESQQSPPTQGESGFTLIELLVVILIIGILAAVAIPSFLNQRGKATDAAAKELAHTAQIAAETYGVDNLGYTGLTATVLASYAPTIQTSVGSGNPYIGSTGVVGAATTYTITATSTNGDTFTIQRLATGAVIRSCTTSASSASGCPASRSW